jgi:hypothetical protein
MGIYTSSAEQIRFKEQSFVPAIKKNESFAFSNLIPIPFSFVFSLSFLNF